MHFDLEISFNGLCFFRFDTDPSGAHPEACRVLMVNADRDFPISADDGTTPDAIGERRMPGRHVPRLVVPAENVILGPHDIDSDLLLPVTVAESGIDLVNVELSGKRIDLEPEGDHGDLPLFVPRHRRRGGFRTPTHGTGRDEWFDWIALIEDVDPDFRVYDHLSLGYLEVAAEICFESGELENYEVGQQRGEPLMFDFLNVCGEAPTQDMAYKAKRYSRCLADRLVLRFRRLDQPLRVTIRKPRLGCEPHERPSAHWGARPAPTWDEHFVFGIGPSRPEVRPVPPVRASVTNLDRHYHRAPRAIYDFLWFYELGCWPSFSDGTKPFFDRIIPWARASKWAGRTPSNGNCPPAGG